MPLNTRAKKRQPATNAVTVALSESTAAAIKINVSRTSREEGGKVIYRSSLIDISASGCSIDSPYLIPTGIDLDLIIDHVPFCLETGVKRDLPVKASGKVRSCTMKAGGHYRLGVLFTAIPEEDTGLIERFIKVKETS